MQSGYGANIPYYTSLNSSMVMVLLYLIILHSTESGYGAIIPYYTALNSNLVIALRSSLMQYQFSPVN